MITSQKYPEHQYGDKVIIKGKLQTPAEFESFSYKNYFSLTITTHHQQNQRVQIGMKFPILDLMLKMNLFWN